MAAPIEIEFIDDAGRYALMMLPKEKEEAVRARCEDVSNAVAFHSLHLSQYI